MVSCKHKKKKIFHTSFNEFYYYIDRVGASKIRKKDMRISIFCYGRN